MEIPFATVASPQRYTGRTKLVKQEQGSCLQASVVKIGKGKEDVIVDVRGFRIPLSTDSQRRVLSLIPPGSDGFSAPNVLDNNTPPLYSPAEVDWWYQAGPEFQHGSTRFRTYNNPFEAGVVLPRDILVFHCAPKHITTQQSHHLIQVIIITIFRCDRRIGSGTSHESRNWSSGRPQLGASIKWARYQLGTSANRAPKKM